MAFRKIWCFVFLLCFVCLCLFSCYACFEIGPFALLPTIWLLPKLTELNKPASYIPLFVRGSKVGFYYD